MTDLIVIGGGLSGLVCATRAAELGLKTVLLEKGEGERYPCNSRSAGGILHICYSEIEQSPEELRRLINAKTGGEADPAQVDCIAGNAARMIRWLADHGAEYTETGALSWQRFALAPLRPARAGLDFPDHGPDRMLHSLIERFGAAGGVIGKGARVDGLVMEGETCVGVRAGETVHRAGAVAIADGGFPADHSMLRQYICPHPEKLVMRHTGSAAGDGIRMAHAAGAALKGMDRFYGHLLARKAMEDPGLWPYPQVDTLASAGLLVGADGRRIADEGLGGVYLSNRVAKLEDPLSTFAIFDAAIWNGPGKTTLCPANPNAEQAGGVIHRADGIAELADLAGLPKAALEETVRRYNAAVADGTTDKLDPPHSPYQGQKQWPIAEAPFHAMPLCVGLTNTMGGIWIDGECRALRENGTPIDGLYAVGSSAGGLEGGGAIGYVSGLTKAAVFGLVAGEHVAARKGIVVKGAA